MGKFTILLCEKFVKNRILTYNLTTVKIRVRKIGE